jgi:transcriptional regulator with XRE-family HTH domain
MHANRLKELRLEQNWTMEEVGKKVGIKKSSYASYEQAYRQPPLEKLKSFSKLYGVSVDYILGLTDERKADDFIKTRFKIACNKRGFHWDGLEVPEDVMELVETILDEAAQRFAQQDYSKEG